MLNDDSLSEVANLLLVGAIYQHVSMSDQHYFNVMFETS